MKTYVQGVFIFEIILGMKDFTFWMFSSKQPPEHDRQELGVVSKRKKATRPSWTHFEINLAIRGS
jgi:hypothetical protein